MDRTRLNLFVLSNDDTWTVDLAIYSAHNSSVIHLIINLGYVFGYRPVIVYYICLLTWAMVGYVFDIIFLFYLVIKLGYVSCLDHILFLFYFRR